MTPKVRSRQSSREGWNASARTEPDGAVSRPKPTQPKKPVTTGGAVSATNGTLNGVPNGTSSATIANQSQEAKRGATTPTGGVKMRRSAPPKASPSLDRQTAQNGTTGVNQQTRNQTNTPKSEPKPKPDFSKKVKPGDSTRKNVPEQQKEQQQQQKAKSVSKPSPKSSKKQANSSSVGNSSDAGSPAVSLVIDETVGQLIDLEIDEPANRTPPADKTSTPREKRPISNKEPSPAGSESGLQSRLDFNSLNLKKVMFNKPTNIRFYKNLILVLTYKY